MFAVSFLLLALAPVGALAVDVKAQFSTHLLWYYDPFQGKPHSGASSSTASSPAIRGACVHSGGVLGTTHIRVA
jgi:hypothetical protein